MKILYVWWVCVCVRVFITHHATFEHTATYNFYAFLLNALRSLNRRWDMLVKLYTLIQRVRAQYFFFAPSSFIILFLYEDQNRNVFFSSSSVAWKKKTIFLSYGLYVWLNEYIYFKPCHIIIRKYKKTHFPMCFYLINKNWVWLRDSKIFVVYIIVWIRVVVD